MPGVLPSKGPSGSYVNGVPVIDGANFMHKEPSEEVVRQVADALSIWGFFQIINHGIDQDFLNEHLEASKRFFTLPDSVKQSISRTNDNAMGYCDKELTKQKVDTKEVFDYRMTAHPNLPDDHPDNADPSGTNQWPEGEEDFKAINKRFLQEINAFSFQLVKVLARGLGLPSDGLSHMFLPTHNSMIRLNYYPVTPDAEPGSFGVGPHKDAGFVTVLLQDPDVPALQVLRDGEWIMVEPIRGAITINGGDMLQVLSNDRFIASNHRVLRSTWSDRYTRLYDFNPAPQAVIKPIIAAPAATGTGIKAEPQAPHYRSFTWADFYQQRLDGNFADLGEEIQIEHFRLDGKLPQQAKQELGKHHKAAAAI